MKLSLYPFLCVALLTAGSGCTPSSHGQAVGHFTSGVGTVRLEIPHDEMILPIQIWYPSTASPRLRGIENFEPPGQKRAILENLLHSAPDQCVRKQMSAVSQAPVQTSGGPYPVVVFSHCHSCIRFSAFSMAEMLATHGYVVVAPDHQGDTLYERLEGRPSPLNGAVLESRASQIIAAVDALMLGHPQIPAELKIDPERMGVVGHSFGAVTMGIVMQTNDHFSAGVAVAAPIENPLIPGVRIAEHKHPLLYLLATEDNSITALGNALLRRNYEAHPVAAWKIEVEDAGHWSFSDICGLTDFLQPGCGQAQRQTDPSNTVVYLDNTHARAIANRAILTFFDYTLKDDPAARLRLESAQERPEVYLEFHQGK